MITVTGIEGTSEHKVALAIRDALLELWPDAGVTPGAEETVCIAANATISGYRVSDIDVLVVGRLRAGRSFMPTRVVRDKAGDRRVGDRVEVATLAIAVEVKDHDPERCRISGDRIEVQYVSGGAPSWKSATGQNMDQAVSLKSYFADRGAELFVGKTVVMNGFDRIPCSGALGREFSGPAFLTSVAETSRVFDAGGTLRLGAGRAADIDIALGAPVFVPIEPSSLDRRRMDMLVARDAELEPWLAEMGRRQLRFRGRGGSGKTVTLLKLAYRKFVDEGSRSIFLTYNQALTSDVRRLMTLLNIHSGEGIAIRTVMSFAMSWLHRLGMWDDKESVDYTERYAQACRQATEALLDGQYGPADIARIVRDEPERFAFDHILVDEGQDCPQYEIDLLQALYGFGRLCIADGVDQMLRGQGGSWDFSVTRGDSMVVPLRRCLRMKRNLSTFANAVAEAAGSGWRVEPEGGASGGKVFLLDGPYSGYHELHRALLAASTKAGNAPVDMLFCTPPGSATEADGRRSSTLSTTLSGWGHTVWEGVDNRERRDFPVRLDDVRVIGYPSCRGLEGWVTVTDGLDGYWTHMLKHGKHGSQASSFPLGDEAVRLAWQACMIPLTRPMDTLVITLHEQDNPFSAALRKVARAHPDIVQMLEPQAA